MLVMRVVDVFVIVFQHFVRVQVAVLFGEMQPDAHGHEGASDQQSLVG